MRIATAVACTLLWLACNRSPAGAAGSASPSASAPADAGALRPEEAAKLRALATRISKECRLRVNCPVERDWLFEPLIADPRSSTLLLSLLADKDLEPHARALAAKALGGRAFGLERDPALTARIVAIAESAGGDVDDAELWTSVGDDVGAAAMASPPISDRVEALLRKNASVWLVHGMVPHLLQVGPARFGDVLLDVAKARMVGASSEALTALGNTFNGVGALSVAQQAAACDAFLTVLGDAQADADTRSSAAFGAGGCPRAWDKALATLSAWLEHDKTQPRYFVTTFLEKVAKHGTEPQKREALRIEAAVAKLHGTDPPH